MNNSTSKSPESPMRTVAMILLPLLGIALVGAAIYLKSSGKGKASVTVVYTEEQAGAPAINTGDIVDATVPGAVVAPRLGYRYKVFVDDESDDRSSGIAKIGGLVTFIPSARRGQTAIVDITRVRDRVADAVLVKVLSQVDLPPKAARQPFTPAPGDSAGHVVVGAEMDVVISEASSKNPDTEGIAKVNGLIVCVNGVTEIGQRVNVRITDRRERIAFAEPTGKPAGTEPLPTTSPSSSAPRATFTPPPGDPVVLGAEMDVVISEASSKNPSVDGIARVGGLVVVVNGVPTIGQRVNVRITGRLERMAFAEPTGKPAGTEPLPAQTEASRPPRPPREPRAAFIPKPNDSAAHVVPGAVIATAITETSSKNPTTEGVARVNGLVVFVKGATTIGQTVNVRITERRERIAIGEVTTDAPTPLPQAPAAPAEPAAPAAPPAP